MKCWKIRGITLSLKMRNWSNKPLNIWGKIISLIWLKLFSIRKSIKDWRKIRKKLDNSLLMILIIEWSWHCPKYPALNSLWHSNSKKKRRNKKSKRRRKNGLSWVRKCMNFLSESKKITNQKLMKLPNRFYRLVFRKISWIRRPVYFLAKYKIWGTITWGKCTRMWH